MTIENIFSSREEIDSWFEEAIDGMARAMATETYHSSASQASGEYHMLLVGLNRARERLYKSLNVPDTPAHPAIRDVMERSLKFTNAPASQ